MDDKPYALSQIMIVGEVPDNPADAKPPDKEKVDKAKPLAEAAITEIKATNSMTAGDFLEAITKGISSVEGVTASWKEDPTITSATEETAGVITGTIVLTSGSETVEVIVNKTIPQLGSDSGTGDGDGNGDGGTEGGGEEGTGGTGGETE